MNDYSRVILVIKNQSVFKAIAKVIKVLGTDKAPFFCIINASSLGQKEKEALLTKNSLVLLIPRNAPIALSDILCEAPIFNWPHAARLWIPSILHSLKNSPLSSALPKGTNRFEHQAKRVTTLLKIADICITETDDVKSVYDIASGEKRLSRDADFEQYVKNIETYLRSKWKGPN
jgi:hypothetical protein